MLGSDITALGVMRSLGRAKIPLVAITDKRDLSAWSRYYKRDPLINFTEARPQSLQAWLAELPIEQAVLMPCSDEWMKAVSQVVANGEHNLLSCAAKPEVIDTLVNKHQFSSVLEDLRLPHPKTIAVDTKDDLDDIDSSVLQYAFLKPHESQKFLATCGVKGMFVNGRTDAKEKLMNVRGKGLDVVLQEYIPGAATCHFFVDGFVPLGRAGMRLLARQRLRMYPPDFGNSTDMVTISLDDVRPAIETLEVLFESIGFHGIFSAEFKFDDRDKQFKVLEVNCRPWWYVDFADRCGLHVCKYAYQEALDLPIDPFESYTMKKRAVYPSYDWAARKKNLDKGYKEQSIYSMIHTWLFGYQPVFSWSDPLPALVNFFRLLKGAILRRVT